MKEVILDENLVNFDGTPLNDLKAKGVMLGCLGAYPGKDEKNKFLAFDLGVRIAKEEATTLLLEKAEYSVLLEAVKANQPQYLNLIHVQVLRLVEGAKEVEVEKKS